MTNIVKTEVPCMGDGNEDKKVNGKDIRDWEFFFRQTNPVQPTPPVSPPYNSSWYDFNHDGYTDMADLQVIREHFGANCKHTKDDESEALEENEGP